MRLTLGMCCLGYRDPKRVSVCELCVGCCVCAWTHMCWGKRGRGGEGKGGEKEKRRARGMVHKDSKLVEPDS